ncbi:dol-P-Glc:Glc(2)Man(9)GlcNAc(2)-PP-Dol alpha-1,2-glucosyltransferase [Euwallacea similis]|uniref:dol-P-Glc:Glc(2)Man(9)GlcNAc(2)-PP-Dol alpha-1,2-glucosyltransferase n=1 Tax=Euwallacea similis TaxID=1736056 RepID=UPI00344B4774
MSFPKIYLLITFALYVIFSKFLFYKIYITSKLIVDEEFHLPLGQQYCYLNFNIWDPKVTTLPGLYLISAAFLGPLRLCSIYWLRSISLLFSCVNFILFYILFSKSVQSEWQRVFSALMMTLLPPLYFLSHIYYTDIVSLTTLLLFIIANEKGYHYSASVAGFLSVVCRQTNVLFVAIYGAKYILTELHAFWAQKKDSYMKAGKFPLQNLKPFIMGALADPVKTLRNSTFNFWMNSFCYISIIFSFLIFLWLNNGIVVGDRNAHNIGINIPQIFYFSLFCLVFGWPYFVGEVLNFANFARSHKVLIITLTVIFGLIIRLNTVVHPYLLADNRHLIFYIWSRFFGKYWWFRYMLIPFYIFGLYVIIKTLWDKTDLSFFIPFTLGMTILLASQSLLELRYFLAPYVILRLKMKNKDSGVFNVILEFVTYSVMNMITFNIFFTKTLRWDDMDYPQKIIW